MSDKTPGRRRKPTQKKPAPAPRRSPASRPAAESPIGPRRPLKAQSQMVPAPVALHEDLRDEEDVRLQDAYAAEATAPRVSGEAAVATAGEAPLQQATLWGDAWRQLRRNPLFLIAMFLIVLFGLMALWPGLFTNQSPGDCSLSRSVQRPTSGHWFGYDIQGCDYFSRVVHGARVSMTIGVLVVGFDLAIAVLLGSLAGYYGRWSDTLIARIADVFFALPTILAAIVILSVLGNRGLFQVSLVLIVLSWPTMMRLIRSSVLSVKEMDYVQAARALGAGDFRILRLHILPNAIAPVIVYATITIGIIIVAEAALSFLGVGLQLPAISWGLMISAARSRILLTPHLLFFPALFLSLLVFSFILLGEALRDALDPRLR